MKPLIDASKNLCRRKTEKTQYMLLSPHQNAKQYYGMKIANKLFEKWHS
jgi:hypothetical protein